MYADDGLVFANIGETRLIGKVELYNLIMMLANDER